MQYPGAMLRQLCCFLLVSVCFALVGCGTMANLDKGGPAFGGVHEAANAGYSRINSVGSGRCIAPVADYAAAGYWWLIDVPASIVADTVTLPVTVFGH